MLTAGVPGGSLNCGVMIGNETRRRNWPYKGSQHCAGDETLFSRFGEWVEAVSGTVQRK